MDTCVPILKLTQYIIETKADIVTIGISMPIIGHVGDGNFHAALYVFHKDKQEME